MSNEDAAELSVEVVVGNTRDSLFVLDVLYEAMAGQRPEVTVADTASYSDVVVGALTLAGFAYSPQLADLPLRRCGAIERTADYEAFRDAARGSTGAGPNGTGKPSRGSPAPSTPAHSMRPVPGPHSAVSRPEGRGPARRCRPCLVTGPCGASRAGRCAYRRGGRDLGHVMRLRALSGVGAGQPPGDARLVRARRRFSG
ncbi:Tn3 family transposase [Streptomyces lydicus]|nr:transposase [Streptomyces lydicus]MCZ1012067.1 Tn3 family transposase [Streptomyces lydicus]